jgi:hypothetical protein
MNLGTDKDILTEQDGMAQAVHIIERHAAHFRRP